MVLGAVLAGGVFACGTNIVTVAPPAASSCDSTQCVAGNTCVALTVSGAVENKCRKYCFDNTTTGGSCPAAYTCVATNGVSVSPKCTKADADVTTAACGAGYHSLALVCPADVDTSSYGCRPGAAPGQLCCDTPPGYCAPNADGVKVGDKQYGTPCNAAEGFADNPACDNAQGFSCYGISPTDGNAYCTRYGCASDRECSAGFWCATIDTKPNVSTTKRSPGQVTTACLRREYCAVCTSDMDCPAQGGKTAHCIPDDSGISFCSPECENSTACGYEQKCTNFGYGYKSCYPRAGVCVGDGSLCSPCRSDADCGDDGACIKSEYSTEKSCAKKSKIPCGTGATQGTDFDCPAVTNGAKAQIRCLGSQIDTVPANYCHGLYALGESGDVGCFTPDR